VFFAGIVTARRVVLHIRGGCFCRRPRARETRKIKVNAGPPGFSRMVERAGAAAGLGIKVHAHMLRHACGYKLANDGVDMRSLQAFLGHKNIQNTAIYATLAPDRFRTFWKD
jgi:integrase